MSLSYSTTIFAIAQVFIIGFAGYFLVKRKIIKPDDLNLLSRLAIGIFYPALVFANITGHFHVQQKGDWWLYPLFFYIMGLTALIMSRLLFLFYKDFKFKREFTALMIFQNCGYIPLLLVSAILAGDFLADMMINIFLFCLGFDLIIWSFGVWLLSKRKMEKQKLTSFLNPPLVAVVSSLLIVFMGLADKIPDVIQKSVGMISQCALPFGMMVVGGNLAAIDLKDTKKRDIALVVLVKLILLPALALWVVLGLRLTFQLGFLIVLQAAAPSAMTLSIVARHYKGEEKFINQSIFYTHLFSMITIPVFWGLYLHLMGF